MSITSWVENIIIGLLEDPRVQQWADERITKALDAQRDELFAKIEASGAGVIGEVGGKIDANAGRLEQNLASLSQGLGGLSNSIVGAVVSQIKSIIPIHLLPKRADYDNP